MEFAEKVKKLMKEQDINARQLSEKTGITESSMSKYLSGKRTPRTDTVLLLAKALGVTPNELLVEDVPQDVTDFLQLKGAIARSKSDLDIEQKKELIKLLLED